MLVALDRQIDNRQIFRCSFKKDIYIYTYIIFCVFHMFMSRAIHLNRVVNIVQSDLVFDVWYLVSDMRYAIACVDQLGSSILPAPAINMFVIIPRPKFGNEASQLKR